MAYLPLHSVLPTILVCWTLSWRFQHFGIWRNKKVNPNWGGIKKKKKTHPWLIKNDPYLKWQFGGPIRGNRGCFFLLREMQRTQGKAFRGDKRNKNVWVGILLWKMAYNVGPITGHSYSIHWEFSNNIYLYMKVHHFYHFLKINRLSSLVLYSRQVGVHQ